MDITDILNEMPTALLFSLFAACATLSGLVIAVVAKDWIDRRLSFIVGFAAGALVTTSVVHLIPEATHLMNPHRVGMLVLVGFFIGIILNHFVQDYASRNENYASRGTLITAILGIALHSFADGFTYVVTFETDHDLGLLTATGLILHELPEGLIIYSLMRSLDQSKFQSLVVAFCVAAVTTPLGVLTALPFIHDLSEVWMTTAFTISSGLVLYIGASHLLPHAERAKGVWNIVAILLGGGAIYVLDSLIAAH